MTNDFLRHFFEALRVLLTDVGARYNTQLQDLFHGDGKADLTFEQQNSKLGYARFLCQVLMLIKTLFEQLDEDKHTGMNLDDIVGNVIEHHGRNVSRKAGEYLRIKVADCARAADLKEGGFS